MSWAMHNCLNFQIRNASIFENVCQNFELCYFHLIVFGSLCKNDEHLVSKLRVPPKVFVTCALLPN